MPRPAAQPQPIATLVLAARGAFVIGVLAVSVLSLAPSHNLPDLHLSDKVLHAVAYASLASAGCFGFGLTSLRAQLAIAAALSVFGVAIEILQPLIGARSDSVADAVANQIGIVLGWILARSAAFVLQRPRSA